MPNHTTTHSKLRRFLRFAKLILGLVLLVLEIIGSVFVGSDLENTQGFHAL